MAGETGYSKIATNGLTFAYDTGDTRNSFLGRPTSNILANAGMSTYNNVGGDVSSNLYTTSETYRGATVWRQDLTALNGTGASYLSNGNNPGIGVVTAGGGGNANQYSGHSIFFKPLFTTTGCPVYTNYSNIGGWQSSCNFEAMGDGWFRAYVLWYDTVSRSDGKYWAINPLSTGVGQTMTVYWAGPFREDLNSTSISQFINGTRSDSQSVLDLTRISTATVYNSPFTNPAINPQLNFDGTDDYMLAGSSNFGITSQFTIEVLCKPTNIQPTGMFNLKGPSYDRGIMCHWPWADGNGYFDIYNTAGTFHRWYANISSFINTTALYHFRVDSTGAMVVKRNAVTVPPISAANFSGTVNLGESNTIGAFYTNGGLPWAGQIYVFKVYNRGLTDGEIEQNYNHYKTRFNLS